MSDEHTEDLDDDATSTEEEEEFEDVFSEAGKEADEKTDKDEEEDADKDEEEIDADAGKDKEKIVKDEKEAADKAKIGEEEGADKEKAKEKETPEETEEDKRGKEILAKEEADRQAKEKEEADKAKAKVGEEADGKPKFTVNDVKAFSNILVKDKLPETVDIGDGVEVNVREFLEDFPAAQAVITMMFRELMGNLINNGVLVTGDSLSGIKDSVSSLDFNNAVYRMAPEIEVRDEKGKVIGTERMDVEKILESPEFKGWLPKAPAEHQALFRGTAQDFVMGLKKFAESQNIGKAKEKVKEIDKKASEKKKEHDALHSETIRKRGGGGRSEEDEEAPEDDFDANFNEAAKKRETK